jgi:acetyl esterase/lipase
MLMVMTTLASISTTAQSLEVDIQRGLQYAEHDGIKITGDLYTPKTLGKYPALVAVHGGAFKVGSSRSYQYWGPYLAQRGYVLFAVDYRLVTPDGKNKYPAAIHDVRAAVQFLRSRGESIKVDPDRIALMGDSAGAYLAAIVALAGDRSPFAGTYRNDSYSNVSTKVKACIGVYGVYDRAAAWQHEQVHRGDKAFEKFMGAALPDNRKLYFEASPLSYVTRDNNRTAFLLAWGTEDDIDDPETQSKAFLLALKQAEFPAVRTVILQGAPHFWMSDPIDEPDSYTGFLAPRLVRFLQAQL